MRLDLPDNDGGGAGGASSSGGGANGGASGGDEKTPEIVHRRHSSDPFHGPGGTDPFHGLGEKDPFSGQNDPFSSQDPFSGEAGDAWEDPSAFYDKPPQRQPIPARSDHTPSSSLATQSSGSGGGGASAHQTPSRGFDDNYINSADFTGDSSYEDTNEVLKNIRLMKHLSDSGSDPFHPASDVFMGHNKSLESQGSSGGAGNEQPASDLTPPKTDSYEFPSELAKYPLKREPDSEYQVPRCKEEPTLHMFNYSAKLGPPTAGVTRHESFSRSRNMPLPPLPTEGPAHAPPLPARTGSNTNKPPLPGNHPSMRKQQQQQQSAEEQPKPRLPPMNHPWGNKKRHLGDAAPPTSDGNPPLPPRKKDGPEMTGTSPQPPPPQQQPQQQTRNEDLAFRELIALGYSKAEIDRALRITNDYSMAKMILQEFGGRH